MKNIRLILILVVVLTTALTFVQPAYAHPLGNFTINHFAGLHVKPDGIDIDYVLDMAEIPAFQEIDSIDANRNGRADPAESAGYHPAQCAQIGADLDLRAGERDLPLTLVSSAVEFPAGQAGLLTLRLTCAFRASLSLGAPQTRIEFEDHSYNERLGWREIVVTGEEVSLEGELSNTSLSERLTRYPEDLLSNPLVQRQASFFVSTTPGLPQQKVAADSTHMGPGTPDKNDAFTRLVLVESITWPTLLFALLVSFIWGAMHALTPGHGKTVVGAYLVGSRGTARHALYLGLTTTITHTTGVFALGLVTLFAARFIFPEKLFPWLSFLSGLLVVGIGANLFFSRLRAADILGRSHRTDITGYHHGPTHDHGHPHEHTHDHEASSHHHHDHSSGDHSHSEGDHHHGDHSHLPPGADGAPVSWRSLLALGISGGLLPCPSALVVMLSAIALNRVGFGLVLVFAFSLGLAAALSGIGLMFVYAGRFFNRIPRQSRLLRLLPAASALFITLVGLGIAAQALRDTGLFNL